MNDVTALAERRKKFDELLEESLLAIEELKICTIIIANGSYNEIEELEKLVRKCQILRAQIDKVIEEVREISSFTSDNLDRNNEFKEWCDSIRDKLKEAQEITIKAINSLKINMEKLDNDMVLIRQKRKALQGYGKHRL